MAFGFELELDPKYGYWEVTYVKWGQKDDDTGPKQKKKAKKEVFPCNVNDTFTHTKVIKNSLIHKMCTDAFNETIKGDFFSKEFWYVQINLKKCNAEYAASEADMWDVFTNHNQLQAFYTDTYTDIDDAAKIIKPYVE